MATVHTNGDTTKNVGGKPKSAYDPEFVRDISVQRLIAYYNANPTVLRERLRKQPSFSDRLRSRAANLDAEVRAWLDALSYVPKDHPSYRIELMFRQWCLRLEPAEPPHRLIDNPERESFLRAIRVKHCTDTEWRDNCLPWLEAIDRVRHDRYLKLITPTPLLEDDDEEWV